MRKPILAITFFTLLCIALPQARSNAFAAKNGDLVWFKTITQNLRNDISTGNKSRWNRILAPNFIMTTEDGKILNKRQLLAQIAPLPQGFSGAENIRNLTVRRWKATALVHFWIYEQENAYGQILKTTYVETDTFRQLNDHWKMVAAQVTVVPRNLEAVKIDTGSWPALEGKYGLSGKSSWPYYVFIHDDKLFGGRNRKSATQLIPLSPLVYYQKNSIHIMVFVKDADHRISKILELHKYNEVVLQKIPKS